MANQTATFCIDFTDSTDGIAHELTHSIPPYTLSCIHRRAEGFKTKHVPISLSVECSVCQMQLKMGNQADWLIGKEIMGPGAADQRVSLACAIWPARIRNRA